MFRKSVLFLLLIGSGTFGQSANTLPPGPDRNLAAAAATPSNDQLLMQGKKIFVISETYYVKREQMEAGLINRKELTARGIQVVNSERDADLVLRVKRAAFQNNFPFTFTDRENGVVVLAGTVNSLFGTVSGRIAGRLADRLKRHSQQEQPVAGLVAGPSLRASAES